MCLSQAQRRMARSELWRAKFCGKVCMSKNLGISRVAECFARTGVGRRGFARSVSDRYKKTLIETVNTFKKDVKSFREGYEQKGPMVTGIAPREAVERLKRSQRKSLSEQPKNRGT